MNICSFKQSLLFTDSQTKTESYGNYLNTAGWKNEVINGAQEQSHRLDVLEKLIQFKCRILISTDLMARGIDIENINLIVNLDIPRDCFTYLHRIGRAGRFGSYGIAISFVHGEDELEKFEKMLGDMGGKGLKVLKFPEESEPYDFWNFGNENNLDSILETSQSETEDEKTKMNDTMINNLALMNITRRLIDDDQHKEQSNFNLDALLEDYEQTLTEVEDEKIQITFPSSISDRFDNNDDEPLEEATEEVRHVIFKASVDDISEDDSSENSTEFSDEEFSESETEPASKKMETKLANNPYSSYVSKNYSQWENIYHFQLANIQNYIDASKK